MFFVFNYSWTIYYLLLLHFFVNRIHLILNKDEPEKKKPRQSPADKTPKKVEPLKKKQPVPPKKQPDKTPKKVTPKKQPVHPKKQPSVPEPDKDVPARRSAGSGTQNKPFQCVMYTQEQILFMVDAFAAAHPEYEVDGIYFVMKLFNMFAFFFVCVC